MISVIVLAVVMALSTSSEGSPPAALGTLWEQSMLEGRSVTIALRNSHTEIVENQSSESFEYARGRPETAVWTTRGIVVTRLGEGFWRNGGWVLEGGLLGQAITDSSIIELYGKAIVRRLSYVPFPFHREIPHETGYEFFLLDRRPGARATVLRRWSFYSAEVMVKKESTGGLYEDVRGLLKYDEATRSVTITITGLTRPFE